MVPKKQLELFFCLYLMRQNTEGTYIILKFPRLQNNAHPLQNAGFKLYILVILPSKRAEHCALAADVRGRDDDTLKHRGSEQGLAVTAHGFTDFFIPMEARALCLGNEKCSGIQFYREVLSSRGVFY